MPKIIWKVGVRKNRERKGVESVQEMVTKPEMARKSGSYADEEIKCETIAKRMSVHVHREGM